MKNTLAFGLAAASCITGFVLASQLTAKTVKLYVSEPGEYLIDAPGGNFISAFTLSPNGSSVKCEYLEDDGDYQSRVTNDVLFERTRIEPQCFASFLKSQ